MGGINMQTTLNQVKEVIPSLLKNSIVPLIHGSPALGKSHIMKDIAKTHNLKFIDIRLSQLEPTDLMGLPSYTDNNKSMYKPFELFPLESDPIPEGYKGWLILLDEFLSCNQSVQASAYRLVLDREVGQYKLHDKVYMVACTNLATDNAIVNPISSAMISRFAHFYVQPNHKEWMEWAINNNIHPMITAYLNFKPTNLYTFDADSTDAYASPRTWEMVSRLLDKPTKLITLASLLGEGVALEFDSFIKVYNELPDIKKIITDPDTYPIPTSIGTQWATITMVANNAEEHTSECITYLKRFPTEFHIVALREINARFPKLTAKKDVREWLVNLSKKL